MAYKPELLDALLTDTDPKQLFAKGWLLDGNKKALAGQSGLYVTQATCG